MLAVIVKGVKGKQQDGVQRNRQRKELSSLSTFELADAASTWPWHLACAGSAQSSPLDGSRSRWEESAVIFSLSSLPGLG